MFFFRLGQIVFLAAIAVILAACAVRSDQLTSIEVNSTACESSPELIIDPAFLTINDASSQWRYRQHTGKKSFSVTTEEGVLTIKRVGSEPWAIFRQTIEDERLKGATIRFTADLQGDVSSDVTHLFGAKAGLFLQIGQYPDAYMGDQDPSNGQWDWQTYSVTKTIPEAVNVVKVGFIHQAGEGAIEARNPSLVLLECLD